MAKKGPGSLAILVGEEEPMGDTEMEGDSDDELLGLSEDFISAVQDEDPEALAETIEALYSSWKSRMKKGKKNTHNDSDDY